MIRNYNMRLVWVVIPLVLVVSMIGIVGIQESFAEELTWYDGDSISSFDYYKYSVCRIADDTCDPFHLSMWVKKDRSDDTWSFEILVEDKEKKIRGNLETMKDDELHIVRVADSLKPYISESNEFTFDLIEKVENSQFPKFLLYDSTVEDEILEFGTRYMVIHGEGDSYLPLPPNGLTNAFWIELISTSCNEISCDYVSLQGQHYTPENELKSMHVSLSAGKSLSWDFIMRNFTEISIDSDYGFQGSLEIKYFHPDTEPYPKFSNPISDAGKDKNLKNEKMLLLDGTNSHNPVGNKIVHYWTQSSGFPPLKLSSPYSKTTTLDTSQIPFPQNFTFNLTVYDAWSSMSSSDSVQLEFDLSPKRQIDNGADPKFVVCKESLKLIVKIDNQKSACVKKSSMNRMILTGEWYEFVTPFNLDIKVANAIINNISKNDTKHSIIIEVDTSKDAVIDITLPEDLFEELPNESWRYRMYIDDVWAEKLTRDFPRFQIEFQPETQIIEIIKYKPDPVVFE